MKKLISVIVVAAMSFSLLACSHEETPGSTNQDIPTQTQTPTIHLPVNPLNGPDQELILGDLEAALLQHNPHASLTGAELAKSQTNESTYSVTLNITAETKYADWTYTVDMKYTKYDQGWMVDTANFSSEAYKLARLPDEKAMIDLVNDLINNEEAPTTKPIESGTLDTSNTLETEELYLSWVYIRPKLHVEEHENITMRLRYSEQADSWEYVPYSEDDNLLETGWAEVPRDVDLSGYWPPDSLGIYNGATISNFSWDSFDYEDSSFTAHFYKISGQPNIDNPSFGWYSDGNGHFAKFDFRQDETRLYIYNSSLSYCLAMVLITGTAHSG